MRDGTESGETPQRQSSDDQRPPAVASEARALVERAVQAVAQAQEHGARIDALLGMTRASLATNERLRDDIAALVRGLRMAAGVMGRVERKQGQSAEHLVGAIEDIVRSTAPFAPDGGRSIEADLVRWALESYHAAA